MEDIDGNVPLAISVSNGTEALNDILRDKILEYARYLIITEDKKFWELFSVHCWDLQIVQRYLQEWPDFPHCELGDGQIPIHVACTRLVLFHFF
jgi:hypothetical protein